MNRKELYNKVKQLGLQDQIKNAFGKNFTLVSNEDLQSFIEDIEDTPEVSETEEPQEECLITKEEEMNPCEVACLVFLGVLKDSGKLDNLLSKL